MSGAENSTPILLRFSLPTDLTALCRFYVRDASSKSPLYVGLSEEERAVMQAERINQLLQRESPLLALCLPGSPEWLALYCIKSSFQALFKLLATNAKSLEIQIENPKV